MHVALACVMWSMGRWAVHRHFVERISLKQLDGSCIESLYGIVKTCSCVFSLSIAYLLIWQKNFNKSGPRLNIISYLRMAISMLKIRRPLGRLIFNMGIAIPGKTVFLIETAPWFQWGPDSIECTCQLDRSSPFEVLCNCLDLQHHCYVTLFRSESD